MTGGHSSSSATLIVFQNEGWTEYNGNAYNCEVRLRADAGVFVATAANLPSVTATGATEREALDAIRAELAKAIAAHKQTSGAIPWVVPAPPPLAGEQVRKLQVTIEPA